MTLTLSAEQRTLGGRGTLSDLRKLQKVPAIVYGHGSKNQNVAVDYNTFEKVLRSAGSSSLVDLTVAGGKPLKVIIADVQRDPITDRFLHIDLHEVRMDEKIKTHLELHFVGESPAVKSLGANLIINRDTLEIECLPGDLIASFEVDISGLINFDDSIHVRDLKISPTITVLDELDGSVVSALAPRVEKVEEAPVEEAAPVDATAAAAATPTDAVPAPGTDPKAKKS